MLDFFVFLEVGSHNRYECLLDVANQDPHRSASQIWQIVVGRDADVVLGNTCILFAMDRSATIQLFDNVTSELAKPKTVILQYGVQQVMVMDGICENGQVEK